MRWIVPCIVGAAAAAAVAAVLAGADAGSTAPADRAARATAAPRGVKEDCSTRSEASWPRPFRDPDNLVLGPLALIGGARAADDPWIRRHRWQKFPLLVKAGRTVTVHLDRRTRRFARLGYGPLPQGRLRFRDSHHTVRFVACRFDRPNLSDGGVVGPYTFWSGGVIVSKSPACVPLEVYVGRRSRPRVATLSMDAGDVCETRSP